MNVNSDITVGIFACMTEREQLDWELMYDHIQLLEVKHDIFDKFKMFEKEMLWKYGFVDKFTLLEEYGF